MSRGSGLLDVLCERIKVNLMVGLCYPFDADGIASHAPDEPGVYYLLEYPWSEPRCVYLYVGRAKGVTTSIRSRLFDHRREGDIPGVTHFAYRTCSTASEAEALERSEITRLCPTHNSVGLPSFAKTIAELMEIYGAK